jgi:hypothetical protein
MLSPPKLLSIEKGCILEVHLLCDRRRYVTFRAMSSNWSFFCFRCRAQDLLKRFERSSPDEHKLVLGIFEWDPIASARTTTAR